jgi:hypothetical protein
MSPRRQILIMVVAMAAALVSSAVVFLLRTRKHPRPDLGAWMIGEGIPVLVAFWFFYVLMILGKISR